MIRYKLTDDITLEIADVGRDMDLALMHATGFGIDAWPAWLREKDNPVWWVKDRGLHNVEGVDIPPISTDDDEVRYFIAHLISHNFIIDPGNIIQTRFNGDHSHTFTITAHSGATTTATHPTFAGAVAWAALAFFAEGMADAPEPTVSSETPINRNLLDVLVDQAAEFSKTFARQLHADSMERLRRTQGGKTKDTAPHYEREGDEVHVSYSEAARRVISNANMAEAIRKATEEALNEPYKRLEWEAYTPSPDTIDGVPVFNWRDVADHLRHVNASTAIATIQRTRAAILAALTAEIGDAATADRLTGVVMRALEGNKE